MHSSPTVTSSQVHPEAPMPAALRSSSRLRTIASGLSLVATGVALAAGRAEEKPRCETPSTAAIQGQHVFSCGHSFHYFMPPILSEIAKGAGVSDHQSLGLSAIGG